MLTDFSEVHLEKAHLPIVVTDLGMLMDRSEVQSLKALPPILVTESGMLTVFS